MTMASPAKFLPNIHKQISGVVIISWCPSNKLVGQGGVQIWNDGTYINRKEICP